MTSQIPFLQFSAPRVHYAPKGAMFISEGCYFIAQAGGAPWIFDIILSAQQHQAVSSMVFQEWKLVKDFQGMRTLSLRDENGELLFKAQLGKEEFLLNHLDLYYHMGRCILKSEYCFD